MSSILATSASYLLPAPSDVTFEAQMILGKCPYFSLRGVQCEFDEGVLILRGRVPSFYLKQVAQTLVRGVPGVERVANQLQVASPEPLIEYHGAQ